MKTNNKMETTAIITKYKGFNIVSERSINIQGSVEDWIIENLELDETIEYTHPQYGVLVIGG